LNRGALQAFNVEADFLVKLHRACVVFADRQEGSMKSVDMFFLNRNNIYRHSHASRPEIRFRPLAERP